jgi:hypothetical protein
MRTRLLPPLLVLTLQSSASATTMLTKPERAPFYDIVGLACRTRTDCGYVPALACVEG